MKVGIEELKKIKPGTKKTFSVNSARELQCARAAASYTHLTYPELGVTYRTKIDRKKLTITIEAINN